MCNLVFFFFLMIRRPPRSTQSRSSAASDVYKRQEVIRTVGIAHVPTGLATGGRHLGHHWTAPKGSGHVHVAAGPDHHRGGPETVATVCVGDSGDHGARCRSDLGRRTASTVGDPGVTVFDGDSVRSIQPLIS